MIYELYSQIQVRLATQHFGRSLIKYAYGHYHIRLPKNLLGKVLHCIEQGLIKPNKEMLGRKYISQESFVDLEENRIYR